MSRHADIKTTFNHYEQKARSVIRFSHLLKGERTIIPMDTNAQSAAHVRCIQGSHPLELPEAAERGAGDPLSDHRGNGCGEAFLSGKSLGSGIGLYSRSIRHTLSPPFF
ncbi:MAG TPA: hypothetical protein VIT18_02725, partial [Terrimicrobiaceae bacterium]